MYSIQKENSSILHIETSSPMAGCSVEMLHRVIISIYSENLILVGLHCALSVANYNYDIFNFIVYMY